MAAAEPPAVATASCSKNEIPQAACTAAKVPAFGWDCSTRVFGLFPRLLQVGEAGALSLTGEGFNCLAGANATLGYEAKAAGGTASVGRFRFFSGDDGCQAKNTSKIIDNVEYVVADEPAAACTRYIKRGTGYNHPNYTICKDEACTHPGDGVDTQPECNRVAKAFTNNRYNCKPEGQARTASVGRYRFWSGDAGCHAKNSSFLVANSPVGNNIRYVVVDEPANGC